MGEDRRSYSMDGYLAADGFDGQRQMMNLKRIILGSVLGITLIVGITFISLFSGKDLQGFRIGFLVLISLGLVVTLSAMIIYLPKIGSQIQAIYRESIEQKAKELNEQSSDPTEDR